MRDIVFVCGAKDFHAVDKYRITLKAVYPRKVSFLTDSIESENQPKLITNDDVVHHLYNIDGLLFNQQSSFGNLWRNLVKAILIPVQVYYLKRFYKQHPNVIYHAIPMYYMMLCYLANIPFVATPQGSEILVRPLKSKIYKKYAIKSLQAADRVIVDSINMQRQVSILSGVNSIILKNGFDTTKILNANSNSQREKIISIRGFNPIYRIDEILNARNRSGNKVPISFVYPACEEDYKEAIKSGFIFEDKDYGKLDKDQLYDVMTNSLLAISIPKSDSSPRSVYECIFAGVCVAVTYSNYLDELPTCMRERIFVVDIEDEFWFDKAMEYALKITKSSFIPSDEALQMCDQDRTIKKIVSEVYDQV